MPILNLEVLPTGGFFTKSSPFSKHKLSCRLSFLAKKSPKKRKKSITHLPEPQLLVIFIFYDGTFSTLPASAEQQQ